MKKSFDHMYDLYRYSAQQALAYYNLAEADQLIKLKQKYSAVLDVGRPIKLKDIFNCYAYDNGFTEWRYYKSATDNLIEKLYLEKDSLKCKDIVSLGRLNFSNLCFELKKKDVFSDALYRLNNVLTQLPGAIFCNSILIRYSPYLRDRLKY